MARQHRYTMWWMTWRAPVHCVFWAPVHRVVDDVASAGAAAAAAAVCVIAAAGMKTAAAGKALSNTVPQATDGRMEA